jgi:hypothetical protein
LATGLIINRYTISDQYIYKCITAQKGRTDVVYMILTVLFSIKEERFEPIKLAKPLQPDFDLTPNDACLAKNQRISISLSDLIRRTVKATI